MKIFIVHFCNAFTSNLALLPQLTLGNTLVCCNLQLLGKMANNRRANFATTLQVVAVDVVSIKETMKELKDSVENIQLRLGEAEQRTSNVEDMHAEMKKNIEKCEERMETLDMRGGP